MPDYLSNFIHSFFQALQAFWNNYLPDSYRNVLTGHLMETGAAILVLFFLIAIILILKSRRRRRRISAEEERPESLEASTHPPDRALGKTVEPSGAPEFEEMPQSMPDAETEIPAEEAYPPEVEEAVEFPAERPEAEPVNLFNRLKNGLLKTRKSLTGRIEAVFSERGINAETLEEIEEILITSDVGVNTTMTLIRKIEENAANLKRNEDMKRFLKAEMLGFIADQKPVEMIVRPHVIMVVGVNGVGKTTTIGKLANKFAAEGKKVLLGAADTFRAAAVEQLEIWSNRAGAEIVKHRENADPAAVAFDSVEAAIARKCDIVIIDTAGRLHTKVNLMEQLKKIKRSIDKAMPGAPHDVLLVVDATTGQNALSQAKLFHEGIGVTGIILTKLDGTAKGGIVIGICHAMGLPLRYIGVGETIEDLQPFDPERFVEALF